MKQKTKINTLTNKIKSATPYIAAIILTSLFSYNIYLGIQNSVNNFNQQRTYQESVQIANELMPYDKEFLREIGKIRIRNDSIKSYLLNEGIYSRAISKCLQDSSDYISVHFNEKKYDFLCKNNNSFPEYKDYEQMIKHY